MICGSTENGIEQKGDALTMVNQGGQLRPYPTGRIHGIAFPGTSCQATIMYSLRDKPTTRSTR
jgi:hypothetical protein